MENSDFAFMKSGFNNIEDASENEKMKKNIVGTIVHFSENALKTAGIYTKHSNRNIITSEDIKRSFMLEVFLFCNRENLQDNIENVIRELYDDDGYGEEDDEYDSDEETSVENNNENDIIFEEDIENSFKESSCNCAICKCLNNIQLKWNDWSPETPLQHILKKHINNI